jgi:hypothetical protein
MEADHLEPSVISKDMTVTASTSSGPRLTVPTTVLLDKTPTPTKLLRDFEAIGLFQGQEPNSSVKNIHM